MYVPAIPRQDFVVINEELNGPNIIAKPLEVDDYMEIGYILPAGIRPSALTANHISYLKEAVTPSLCRKTLTRPRCSHSTAGRS